MQRSIIFSMCTILVGIAELTAAVPSLHLNKVETAWLFISLRARSQLCLTHGDIHCNHLNTMNTENGSTCSLISRYSCQGISVSSTKYRRNGYQVVILAYAIDHQNPMPAQGKLGLNMSLYILIVCQPRARSCQVNALPCSHLLMNVVPCCS